jgi:polyisoprenoid-binding protein YceI
MGRVLTTLVVVGLVAGMTSAGEVKMALTGDNTTIKFVGTKPQGKHNGGFKKLTGTATYDGKDVTTMQITVDIDMNSTYADVDKLTNHLKSPDFFDVKNNPSAKFVSSKVEKSKDGYTVTGKLTMAGKTKELSFPAQIQANGDRINLDSTFKINRHDWGISYGKGMIDDDVSLTVALGTKKK